MLSSTASVTQTLLTAPRWPDAVQEDQEVDPLAGISQLLEVEVADQDGEKDAGNFTKPGQELEGAARPSAHGWAGRLEDDQVVDDDIHDQYLLQVVHGELHQEHLEGFDPGELGLNDGQDEKHGTH